MIDEDVFTEIPWSFLVQVFLDSLVRARRDLWVDPLLADPWSCDPERCLPLLGENLCCKVQTRCPEFQERRCTVHEQKPFSCALFPLDLVQVGSARVVTTVRNQLFFATGWCRYDRDMLECFEGEERGTRSMFEVQRHLLERLFTRSEVILMERSLATHSAGLPHDRREGRAPAKPSA